MSTPLSESVWLNDVDVCQVEYLAEASGLSIEEIEDLVDTGIIKPAETGTSARMFQLRYVVTVKTARRLRDDFELDQRGLALALSLLQRIEELQAEIHATKARLGHPR
ncbi:chaperone modulator CbpM [Caballeronia sp. 15715]|uniref:chaperone modulator CbpM n=1 Tax=unclassified Caballeronia TaxID=2646786 RepID=UPI0039E40607